VARGVAAARVEIAGRGERELIADNATDAGRTQNRRVEIFLREPTPA
jgi:outer membrane protein OmpA-like peptidoglycan-associated protein